LAAFRFLSYSLRHFRSISPASVILIGLILSKFNNLSPDRWLLSELKDLSPDLRKITAQIQLRTIREAAIICEGAIGWQGTAWAMERLYPKEFSRPEVQLQYKLAENVTKTGDVTGSAEILDWLNGETPRIRELVNGSAHD
jgi:hypothetical protein